MIRKLYLSYLQLNHPEYRVKEGSVSGVDLRSAGQRIIARLVFAAYILLLLKPVMPVATDMLAHTFWKHRHLQTVHTEHGRQHVHFELCRTTRDSEKDKSTGKYKYEFSEDIFLVAVPFNLGLRSTRYPSPVFRDYCFHFPPAFPDPEFIPPRA